MRWRSNSSRVETDEGTDCDAAGSNVVRGVDGRRSARGAAGRAARRSAAAHHVSAADVRRHSAERRETRGGCAGPEGGGPGAWSAVDLQRPGVEGLFDADA